jgi:hypothetical protein
MKHEARAAFRHEVQSAREEIAAARVEVAFVHLERAHILGQRDTVAHVHSHWLMLRLAASVGQWREVVGQAIRIVAAALFSRIWVPIGNTGRANVSALRPMPVPEDLRALVEPRSAPWR